MPMQVLLAELIIEPSFWNIWHSYDIHHVRLSSLNTKKFHWIISYQTCSPGVSHTIGGPRNMLFFPVIIKEKMVHEIISISTSKATA